MSRSAHRPRLLVVLAAVLGLMASLLLAAPAQAANGTITGKMLAKPSSAAATPFGADEGYVRLFRSDAEGTGGWKEVASADTNASGVFTASGLADGYYRIWAFDERPADSSERLAEEYYDDGWSPYAATAVRVQNGQTVALNDIVLEPAGSVTGTVKDEAGQPLTDASVTFISTEGSGGGYGFQVDDQGRFDSATDSLTDNLIPGTYRVSVSTPNWPIGTPVYRSETVEVEVEAGKATALPAITLRRLATTTFTVVDPDGTPLADAPLALEVFYEGEWGPIQSGPHCTDAQGRYRFIEGWGRAKVHFGVPTAGGCEGQGEAPAHDGLVGEYWDDVYALEDAEVIEVAAGSGDTQHTVTLGTAPTIKKGTVSIAGEPQVGKTLTAQPGTWTPSNVTLSYQWLNNGKVIAGATDRELVLTEDLEGAWLGVRVVGRLTGEKSVDERVWVGKAVEPGTSPTIVAGTPKISGTAGAGRTLRVQPGSWGPAGVKLAYQWLADGKPIAGAAATTFKPSNSQAGQRLSVRVTGTASGVPSVSRTSAQTAAVQGVITARRPTITGTARKGKKLTARVKAWSPKPVKLRYQWLRNGKRIKGATSRSYRLKSADVGKRITIRVTGTKKHYAKRVSTSAKTAKVRR